MGKKEKIIDYSKEVEEAVAKWTRVAIDEKKLQDAIDGLLVLEKKCRVGDDHESGSILASTIVDLCFQAKDYESLKVNLVLISKRRGQLKQVVKASVQASIDQIAKLDGQVELKVDLIAVLRTITEGKIFVENERARLTKTLAEIREAEGKVKEASELMQDIQVETYGAMDKREKSEFILEQIRLCLDSCDNIRAVILSDKISKKLLADKSFQDIKLRFHKLMIRYYVRKANFLAICRANLEIYHTPIVQDSVEERNDHLKAASLFCALSPFDSEQSDLANRIQGFKSMEDLPAFKKLLKLFTTPELIMWPKFHEAYSAEIDGLSLMSGKKMAEPLSSSSDDLMASAGDSTPLETLVWTNLRNRVIEHNIRTVSQHYSRIQVGRLSELVCLGEDETEEFVSALVATKTIYAKIDRAQKIISFRKDQKPAEKLNDWSSDVGQLLNNLERVSHLIHRENMVHKIYD